MDVPEVIDCVDCGCKAHRLTLPPEEGWEPGDIVAYRCGGCQDRWDLVVEDDAVDSAPDDLRVAVREFWASRQAAQ